jgi:hypothetical protein
MGLEWQRQFFGGRLAFERLTLTLRKTTNVFVGLRVGKFRLWLCKL